MKSIVTFSLFAAVLLASCSNNAETPKQGTTTADSATPQATAAPGNAAPDQAPVSNIVSAYLELKNALAADNGNGAATGAKNLSDALSKLDVNALPATQKPVYTDVADDMKEHAEHIASNAGKIDHQREHFETLSKDLYDLVKAGGAKQSLYKDFCPMYNNNKGGMWLSETKEIKNPYLGQKMPTCGEMQEEMTKK